QFSWPLRTRLALPALLVVLTVNGCASISNPVADGIPVRRLPPEVLAISRRELTPLPLSLLRQKQPDTYRLDAGDVLGIWIHGALGKADQPILVKPGELGLSPFLGYPVLVQSDGTISLPLLSKPLVVKGLSLAETRDKIFDEYVEKRKIVTKESRFLVTLQRRRRYHVVVVRQDSAQGGGTAGGGGAVRGFGIGHIGGAAGTSGRGTGGAPDMPAYENDVMTALAQSGGLPGFGAADEVIIERGSLRDGDDPAAVAERLKSQAITGSGAGVVSDFGAHVTRIPL